MTIGYYSFPLLESVYAQCMLSFCGPETSGMASIQPVPSDVECATQITGHKKVRTVYLIGGHGYRLLKIQNEI